MTSPGHDVLIVGAGISGISMAAHLGMMCPDLSYAILERRARPGGTWDLFRYPGVRSDSDMHSLGFAFAPWRGEKAIAQGDDIRAYLEHVIAERGIEDHVRFGCKVVGADWNGADALWRVTLKDERGTRVETARFLYLASGYYDYDRPHEADLPGVEQFGGIRVHPQFWPQDLDWSGRRVVVIGSGATAVTIVPAMAQEAAHVTMLQRTPGWMVEQPSVDRWALRLRKWLGVAPAYQLTRWLNTRLHDLFYRQARTRPDRVGRLLTTRLRERLGTLYDEAHFLPPYGPWEQRLCLVPDGDLFTAIERGRASIVTDRIAGFDEHGVILASGAHLPADIVVTATGLRLALGGGIAFSLDGVAIDWPKRWFYRNCMFGGVPNLAMVFGYLNASWTLRADMTADYVCRVLMAMRAKGADCAVPLLPRERRLVEGPPFPFSSGYLRRALHLMPRSEARLPWRLNMDYLEDLRYARQMPIEDGILHFAATAQSRVAASGEIA